MSVEKLFDLNLESEERKHESPFVQKTLDTFPQATVEQAEYFARETSHMKNDRDESIDYVRSMQVPGETNSGAEIVRHLINRTRKNHERAKAAAKQALSAVPQMTGAERQNLMEKYTNKRTAELMRPLLVAAFPPDGKHPRLDPYNPDQVLRAQLANIEREAERLFKAEESEVKARARELVHPLMCEAFQPNGKMPRDILDNPLPEARAKLDQFTWDCEMQARQEFKEKRLNAGSKQTAAA